MKSTVQYRQLGHGVDSPANRGHNGVQDPDTFGALNEISQDHGSGVQETADGTDLHGPEVDASSAPENAVDFDINFDDEEIGHCYESGGRELLAR